MTDGGERDENVHGVENAMSLEDPPDCVPWEIPENTLSTKAIMIHW